MMHMIFEHVQSQDSTYESAMAARHASTCCTGSQASAVASRPKFLATQCHAYHQCRFNVSICRPQRSFNLNFSSLPLVFGASLQGILSHISLAAVPKVGTFTADIDQHGEPCKYLVTRLTGEPPSIPEAKKADRTRERAREMTLGTGAPLGAAPPSGGAKRVERERERERNGNTCAKRQTARTKQTAHDGART